MSLPSSPPGEDNSSGGIALERHRSELISLQQTSSEFVEGDTLAVVTFPNVKGRACNGMKWETITMRMSSEKLHNTGSEKIKNMLEPLPQGRFKRRVKKFMTIPEDVVYVIDFTPNEDADDFSTLVASLYLPAKLNLWFLSGYYMPDPIVSTGPNQIRRVHADQPIAAPLVLGHDDICQMAPFCLVDRQLWNNVLPGKHIPGIFDDPREGQPHVPPERRFEEYCPIRHRAAILRLLRAVQRGSGPLMNSTAPLINSASRMWTMVWVAHYLELTDYIRDEVAAWFLAFPNTKFMEVCPEESYRVASALRLEEVAVVSFKILVNELAVDYALDITATAKPRFTWSQRKRDVELEWDAVDYAAHSMAARMKEELDMLRSEHVIETFDSLLFPLLEWRKFKLVRDCVDVAVRDKAGEEGTRNDPTLAANLKELQATLTAYGNGVRGFLHQHVRDSLKRYPNDHLEKLIDAQRAHYVAEKAEKNLGVDRERIAFRWARLTDEQKVVTALFWRNLMVLDPYERFCHFPAAENPPRTLSDLTVTINRLLATIGRPTLFDDNALEQGFQLDLYHTFPQFLPNSMWAELKRGVQHRGAILNRPEERNDHFGTICTLSDHMLLNLSDKELDYLPIWAGGLDDGTFAAFNQDEIPETDMGPSEPGPGYHTGYSNLGSEGDASSVSGTDGGRTLSGFSDLTLGDHSGVPGSLDAQDSISTVMRGYTDKTPSESVASADEKLYGEAMMAEPAAHQDMAMVAEQMMDEADDENSAAQDQEAKMLDDDEDWDFGDDDEAGFDGDEDEDMASDTSEQTVGQ